MRVLGVLFILFAAAAILVLGIVAVSMVWVFSTPGQVTPQFVAESPYLVQPHAYGVPPHAPSWIELLVVFATLMFLGLIFIVASAIAWRLVGHRSRHARTVAATEETRLIQEIYHGLSRMEQRVEALETLLLDRAVPPEFKPADAHRHTGIR